LLVRGRRDGTGVHPCRIPPRKLATGSRDGSELQAPMPTLATAQAAPSEHVSARQNDTSPAFFSVATEASSLGHALGHGLARIDPDRLDDRANHAGFRLMAVGKPETSRTVKGFSQHHCRGKTRKKPDSEGLFATSTPFGNNLPSIGYSACSAGAEAAGQILRKDTSATVVPPALAIRLAVSLREASARLFTGTPPYWNATQHRQFGWR
ncbi:MAG: hypothetical protein NZS48_13710, partial [Gemmata sp.]|nr:hypothetical protein [Gemmata sp.]